MLNRQQIYLQNSYHRREMYAPQRLADFRYLFPQLESNVYTNNLPPSNHRASIANRKNIISSVLHTNNICLCMQLCVTVKMLSVLWPEGISTARIYMLCMTLPYAWIFTPASYIHNSFILSFAGLPYLPLLFRIAAGFQMCFFCCTVLARRCIVHSYTYVGL